MEGSLRMRTDSVLARFIDVRVTNKKFSFKIILLIRVNKDIVDTDERRYVVLTHQHCLRKPGRLGFINDDREMSFPQLQTTLHIKDIFKV